MLVCSLWELLAVTFSAGISPILVLLYRPVSKRLDRGSCDYFSLSLESPSLQGHQPRPLPPYFVSWDWGFSEMGN